LWGVSAGYLKFDLENSETPGDNKGEKRRGEEAIMVDSIEFAKYIISRTKELNKTTRPHIRMGETKLQKLLYICDGIMLSTGINFISENARAWNYGPVYPRVHRWLEKEPDSFVNLKACSPDALQLIEGIDAQPMVDKVVSTFGSRTAEELSAWTHRPGGPWELALARGKGIMNAPISKDDMQDFFSRILNGGNSER
jgi:uncharacterized phage-associated protein